MKADAKSWRGLCGQAVELCGGQEGFQREAAILKRLVGCWGAPEVERMLRGAKLLGWHGLRGLGSEQGIGRRWALEAYWRAEAKRKVIMPERLKGILWDIANQ